MCRADSGNMTSNFIAYTTRANLRNKHADYFSNYITKSHQYIVTTTSAGENSNHQLGQNQTQNDVPTQQHSIDQTTPFIKAYFVNHCRMTNSPIRKQYQDKRKVFFGIRFKALHLSSPRNYFLIKAQ